MPSVHSVRAVENQARNKVVCRVFKKTIMKKIWPFTLAAILLVLLIVGYSGKKTMNRFISEKMKEQAITAGLFKALAHPARPWFLCGDTLPTAISITLWCRFRSTI
jgi:hypothetical protein